jgi:bifunctional non-homologous end joining protein LigD
LFRRLNFDVMRPTAGILRKLPLHLGKNNLERPLARRPEGMLVSQFELGEIEPELFRKACEFGLEVLVSKAARMSTAAARRRTG